MSGLSSVVSFSRFDDTPFASFFGSTGGETDDSATWLAESACRSVLLMLTVELFDSGLMNGENQGST